MPVQALACKECGTEYELEARYVCERCFGPLEVRYEYGTLDPDSVKRRIQAGPQNLWRYSDFLPFSSQPRYELPAGCTPLVRAPRLAEALGLREVWVKNDAANPTHSFKDRVVSIALAKARELGYETVACASTGNLANAVAAHAAAAGLDSYVFIPADLEEQKILATGVYGTKLVTVRGNYDDVNRLCTELSADRDWAFVNVNVRPYYAEGSKTLAYEIAEELGFELPDRVVAPIASGSLFTKIARGFDEWREVGLVEGETPTMVPVARRVEEPAVLVVAESRDDLLERVAARLEIAPLVRRLVRQREPPCDAAVVLEQSGDLLRGASAVCRRDPREQKVRVPAHYVVVAAEREQPPRRTPRASSRSTPTESFRRAPGHTRCDRTPYSLHLPRAATSPR